MGKPYDDNKTFTVSDCTFCTKYSDCVKCSVYPDGIPQEILVQSFPGYPRYKSDYCKKRVTKGN
jgi:hypothetical protein